MSLSALLLAEHDKRHFGGLQPRYLEALEARELALRLLDIVEFQPASRPPIYWFSNQHRSELRSLS